MGTEKLPEAQWFFCGIALGYFPMELSITSSASEVGHHFRCFKCWASLPVLQMLGITSSASDAGQPSR